MIAHLKIGKTLRLGAFCALALGAAAHAQNSESMINNNAVGDWSRWSYVDFSTTSLHAPHRAGTFGGLGGLKYKFLQLSGGNTFTSQQCFEVFTAAPSGLPGTVSDTRIWVISHQGSLTTPISLNNDWNGTKYSAARFWLKGAPGSFVNLAIAARDKGWNTMHFNLVVRQLPLTEAACTNNQTKPFVKVIDGDMQFSANAG